MHLPFRLSPYGHDDRLPIRLYCIGAHAQHPVARPGGFPVMQCFIALRGKGRFAFADGSSLYLGAGQALLLPSDEAHSYDPLPREPWLLGFVGFEGPSARGIADACGMPFGATISLKDTAPLADAVRTLWHLADGADAAASRALSSRLYDFLLLLASLGTGPASPALPPPARQSDAALERAVHYLHEHFAEPLVMSNVASAVGYSVQHFQRLFREAYGEPPLAYLRRFRLHQAAVWLEETPGTPVSEIAGRIGMDPNYFIRAFKQAYGSPPGHYRRGKGK
ncbi:AraC family transcriptional regulator [Cohnella sp. JJ-181]|uniref:AraC family transcriptional regulator n=1 Tax=Cohnella rhizoplanae TaxID=2974897 RepID=UPI0022FF7D1E|nr:AraC family transcriptional regulator [Cohnella sp. JJ-181]CAI6052642.1 HTH-type transcriptional activator RhaS [Cohnella sp. JJ-181]